MNMNMPPTPAAIRKASAVTQGSRERRTFNSSAQIASRIASLRVGTDHAKEERLEVFPLHQQPDGRVAGIR
jgi:hypothetical protein